MKTTRKYITKTDLPGYNFDNFEHSYLFNIVNEKDANGYNGRYFSSWYFDMRLSSEAAKAVTDMIWSLTLGYFKTNAYKFRMGHMSQLRLSSVSEYIAEKMNTWSGEIVRWMRGMEWGKTYDMDICDHWGLDSITIFINK